MFAFKPEGLCRHGSPLRDCGTLHDDEQEVGECGLYFPPVKLFSGRHHKTCMSSKHLKSKKPEQYHYVWRRMLTKRVILPSSNAWTRWHSLEA